VFKIITIIISSIHAAAVTLYKSSRAAKSGVERGDRVRTGHGKSGNSWNLLFQFPGLESHGIEVKVMEIHGKAICLAKGCFKS